MKKHVKSMFFAFILSALIVAPNLHTNAMEVMDNSMMEKDSMMDSKMMNHKLMNTNIPVTIPLTQGFVKGYPVFYISTEASDKDLAEHLTQLTGFDVTYTPALQQTPTDALAQIYAFENGIKGVGPLGFQPNVADSQPGDINYSPLWSVNIVKWSDDVNARELKSQTEILTAQANGELSVTSSGLIVNCPFVQWNGGSLQIRDDKTLTDDTPYGGGQVLDIDAEKMQVTFVAHRGFAPDGSTIYYIATDASKQDVADMLGVTFVERTGATLLSGASSDLYVFTNGISGTGPMGFQASIGSTNAGDKFYSPMWRIQTVTWTDPSSADFLTMTDQITSADSKGALTTDVAGVIVNCPFIKVDEKYMMKDSMMDDNMNDNMIKHMASPRKQMKMGVDAHMIQCKSGHELVFKSTNWSPACVKSSSVAKLVKIGWASDHMPTEMMKDSMMDNTK